MFRSSRPEVFCKKGVTEKHLFQSLFLNKVAGQAWTFVKKETLAQVFSYEFCEISKNTFLHRTPRWLLLNVAIFTGNTCVRDSF